MRERAPWKYIVSKPMHLNRLFDGRFRLVPGNQVTSVTPIQKLADESSKKRYNTLMLIEVGSSGS